MSWRDSLSKKKRRGKWFCFIYFFEKFNWISYSEKKSWNCFGSYVLKYFFYRIEFVLSCVVFGVALQSSFYFMLYLICPLPHIPKHSTHHPHFLPIICTSPHHPWTPLLTPLRVSVRFGRWHSSWRWQSCSTLTLGVVGWWWRCMKVCWLGSPAKMTFSQRYRRVFRLFITTPSPSLT